MKRRSVGARLALPFFIFLALCAANSAFAQSLPKLEVTPQTLGEGGVLTLSLSSAPQGNSTRVAIYEHLRPTKLAEIKKNFTQQNGRWSAQLTLQADPGSYDFRVVSDDKTRAPLSSDAQVLVPGIVREPGWWLLNGDIFAEGDIGTQLPRTAPFMLPALKRKAGDKARDLSWRVVVNAGQPLEWNPIWLLSLREALKIGDDQTKLRANILKDLDEEENGTGQGTSSRGFYPVRYSTGVVVVTGDERTSDLLPDRATRVLESIRQIVNARAPDAPLAIAVGNRMSATLVAHDLSLCAPYADAVVNLRNSYLWPLKVARRAAEQHDNYDLPIFVRADFRRESLGRLGSVTSPVLVAEAFMSGATGIVTYSGYEVTRSLELHTLFQRNSPLFIGSVTLEDAGLLLPPDIKNIGEDQTENLFSVLQNVGRIPGAARIQSKTDKKIPESFLCALGDSISAETIEKLRVAAEGGARIYLEGSPKIEGDAARWNALVGAASTPITNKQATVTFDDPWLFGAARGGKVLVQQSVEVGALNPPSAKPPKAEQPEKGKDVLTEPRVVAKLEDGSPALIENPIGDGEVLWLPHRVLGSSSSSAAREFYAAIAAHLGTGLLKISSTDNASTSQSTPSVRAAIRRSPKGTWLVGLFNQSTHAAPITLEVNHFAGVALDLQTEKELPLDVRGNRSSVETTVPASGWQIIAFGESREKLDDERFAPRSKVKLK